MIAVACAHGKAVHNSRIGDGNKICKLVAMKQIESKEWPGLLTPLKQMPPMTEDRPSGPTSERAFHLPIELL